MKTIRAVMLVLLGAVGLLSVARADSIALTLDPTNGALVGPAGSTVGWGFTFTNAGTNFAVISGSDFCVGVITSPCSNSLGTYTDFSQFQFVLAGPSQSVSQAFSDLLSTGLGSFLINSGASGTVSGELVLFYDLCSVDPNSPDFDPLADTLSVGNSITALASVTVGNQATQVPEPRSGGLLALGLGAACLAIRLGKIPFWS